MKISLFMNGSRSPDAIKRREWIERAIEPMMEAPDAVFRTVSLSTLLSFTIKSR